MTRDYVTLRLEFVRLQRDAERFTARLQVAARELRKTGGLTGAIEEHLRDFLHDWDTLSHCLSNGHTDLMTSAPADSSRLSRLEQKLDFHQMRERSRGIIRSVQQLRFNDGADSPELRNVHREMQMLEETLDEPETGRILSQLVDGTHSANALLSLVRDGDRLSDREWAELQGRVSETYGAALATAAVRGRLTMGATQRLRGSIQPNQAGENGDCDTEVSPKGLAVPASTSATDRVVDGGESEAHAELCNVDMTTAADHERRVDGLPGDQKTNESSELTLLLSETSDFIPEAEALPQSVDDSIFDVMEDGNVSHGPALIVKQSAEWQELTDAVIQGFDTAEEANGRSRDDVLSAVPARDLVTLPRAYTASDDQVQQAARAALSDAVLYRDRHVSDVILHLASAGRLGLAMHVARGQEARGGLAVPFLPTWLLEAMTLAPQVTFVRGRLAAMIEVSLANCHERICHDLSDEWKRGMGFFIRAATLRPSVVSPGTRAAAILRSFALNSDCTELYNYCARIAKFGERLQGLMPALFTHRESQVSREDHLRALQAEVRQWCDGLVDHSIAYMPAKQLFLHANWSVKSGTAVRHSLPIRRWQKWQQTLRLSERIVRPVREGDSGRVQEVKAEIRRLSASLSEGSWADAEREGGGDGLIRLPHPAMRNVLREAMAYGQRWIGLHTISDDEDDFFLPQAAEELRSELLARHEGVVAELERVRNAAQSTVVRAGVTCLLRAVHELREMVDPAGPVDPSEADPRHLLHAELLRIPGMGLDERWEPQADAVTVQSRILRFLSNPQPDWQTAFQTRCESGDHIATDRLLALDVWESMEQKDHLREIRDQYLEPTRASLLAELAQFEKRLQVIADHEHLADEQHGLEKRLRRLRDSLGSEAEADETQTLATMTWCREELAALKNGLRAIRAGTIENPFPSPPEREFGFPDDHLLL